MTASKRTKPSGVTIYLPDAAIADPWEIPPGSGIVGRRQAGRLWLAYDAGPSSPHQTSTWADRLHSAWRKLKDPRLTLQRNPAGWLEAGRYNATEGEVCDLPAALTRPLAAWLGYLASGDPTPELELYTTTVQEHQIRRGIRAELRRPEARPGGVLHQQLCDFSRRHGQGDLPVGPRAV